MSNPSVPSRTTPDDEFEITSPFVAPSRSPQFMPIPVCDTEKSESSEDESDPSEDGLEPEEPQPLPTVPTPTGSVNIIRPEPVSLSQIHPRNRSRYARKSVRQPQRVTIPEPTVTASMQMSGRKRNWVANLIQPWRNEEELHSTTEIGGPSNTAPIPAYTQEPLHHIDRSLSLEQAERRAVEAERRTIEAERRAIEAERRTVEAERRTIEAERRAVEAERRAMEAEQHANMLDQRMTTMEQNIERVTLFEKAITQMAAAVTQINQLHQ